MLILGWEGVVDYTDKANEQETSKGHYLKKKKFAKWRQLEFFSSFQ